MLPYNTDLQPVLLPEYGRILQQLVDHCTKIEDRDERTACARSIAATMQRLFPSAFQGKRDESKIWDRLNIMSGFSLDIDFPCEVVTEEKMNPKPRHIPYSDPHIRFRHYGKHIEQMIDRITNLPEGEERDLLVSMTAHHMKKLMLQHNKEGVDDAKILRDLAFYSGGKIDLDPETYLLHEYKEATPVKAQRKRRTQKYKNN